MYPKCDVFLNEATFRQNVDQIIFVEYEIRSTSVTFA